MIDYTIKIREPRKLMHIGDRFYMIYPPKFASRKAFTEPCPACNDTGKIVYKGYEMACGLCSGLNRNRNSNSIDVHNYAVAECFVCEVTVEGPTSKAAYQGKEIKDKHIPHIGCYRAFRKEGNSSEDIYIFQVVTMDDVWDNPLRYFESDLFWKYGRRPEEYYFTKKKDAEAFREILEDAEREKLKEFNKLHGTDYEWPFGN